MVVPAVWTESQQQWWLGVAQDVWRELAQSWGEGLPWRMSWRLWPLQTPEALWSEVDRLALSWARQGAPQSLVVLAADSAVDEAAIEQRLGRGELFTALHQQGRVPGEGAAAGRAASIVSSSAPWETRVPIDTANSLTVPAKGAGISIVALSDSTVISGSSTATTSPGFTKNSTTGTFL